MKLRELNGLKNIIDIKTSNIFDYVNSVILNKEDIKDIISKYKTFKDFKENEKSLYNRLLKRKTTTYFLSDFSDYRNMKRTIEGVKKEMLKFKTLKDFYEKSNGAYRFCLDNNIDMSSLK